MTSVDFPSSNILVDTIGQGDAARRAKVDFDVASRAGMQLSPLQHWARFCLPGATAIYGSPDQ